MIYVTKKITYTEPDQTKTFTFDPPVGSGGEKYTLLWLLNNYAERIEIRASRWRKTFTKGGLSYLPVLSDPGKPVKIEVTGPSYTTDDYLFLCWAKADAYKAYFDNHLLPFCTYTNSRTLSPLERGYVYFRNTKKTKIYNIVSIEPANFGSFEDFRVNINGEDVFYFEPAQSFYYTLGRSIPCMLVLYPGDILVIEATNGLTTIDVVLYAFLQIVETTTEHGPLTKEEATDLFGLHKCYEGVPRIRLPGKWSMTDIDVVLMKPFPATEPEQAVIEQPARQPEKILPFPVVPDEDISAEQVVTPSISLRETARYRDKDTTHKTALNLPNETLTVETIPTPYGVARKIGDHIGRVRTTHAAITYYSGKLEVSDINWRTIYTGYGATTVNFYAKSGDWQIQILTLYEKQRGKDISSANIIFLDGGMTFSLNVEAVEIRASCLTGSGTLYWEVSI